MMKFYTGIILLLVGSAIQAQTKSSWFRCVFNNIDGGVQLAKIELLKKRNQIGYSDFYSLDQNLVAYTKTNKSGSQQINAMDFRRRVNGDFLKCENSLALLRVRPQSNNYSFVQRGNEQDAIIELKNGAYNTIKAGHYIIDYTWVNTNVVAIVEMNEEQKAICYVYWIEEDVQKDISINPGINVHRISDQEVAFIDIFSNEYRYIKSYNLQEDRSTIITKLPHSQASFALQAPNEYYVTHEDAILRYKTDGDLQWRTFFSFLPYNITNLKQLHTYHANQFIIQDAYE